MDCSWVEEMLCCGDDNVIGAGWPQLPKAKLLSTSPCVPAPPLHADSDEFLMNLLKLLPQDEEEEECLPHLEERDVVRDEAEAALLETYEALQQSWTESVCHLQQRFTAHWGHHERLARELEALRQENQRLKHENTLLQQHRKMACPVLTDTSLTLLPGGGEQLPHLLTPSNDISVGDEEDDEKLEPQIDKAKLKTKLCKYFMQAGGREQEGCPFYRRHGWCAFAHGEKELHTATPALIAAAFAHNSVHGRAAGTSSLPATPPLLSSPASDAATITVSASGSLNLRSPLSIPTNPATPSF